MNSLSTILAEIEVSAEKIRVLETDLATEREHGKTLVEQYRSQSGEALKMLGIAETTKERKPRTNEAVLISAAKRKIRQMVKGGEKNGKTLLAAAIETAEQVAKTKLGLTELPVEIKSQIEES
jgi:hypothetical protein